MITSRFAAFLAIFTLVTSLATGAAILDIVETPGDNYLVTACDAANPTIQYWQCSVDVTSGAIYMFRDLTDAGDGSGGHTDYLNNGAYGRKCPLIYFDGRGGNVCTRSGSVSGLADRLSFTAAPDSSSFTITYTEDATSSYYFHSGYSDGDISLSLGELWTTITVVIRPPNSAGTSWDWSIKCKNVCEHDISAKVWAGQSLRSNIYSGVAKTYDYDDSEISGLWNPASPVSFARFTIDENTAAGFTQDRQFILDYRYEMEGFSTGGTISTSAWAGFDYLKYTAPCNLTSNYALQPGQTRSDYGQFLINISESISGTAPVASAGADQNFVIHTIDPQQVTLDASASVDSDGQIVSYRWEDISGDLLATGQNPTIELEEGKYYISLFVEDNDGNIAIDEVVVEVVFEWDYTLYDAWPGRDPEDPNQLTSLYQQDITCPVLTDRTWPAAAGQADICLYADDKFAACSITVDDNVVPNHQFWLDQSNLYGFDITWFVIVGSHRLNSGNGFFGTWDSFRNLYAAGQDVQSHTISHSGDDSVRPDEEIHWEYSYSRALIDENIAPNHCLAVAYPSGNGKPEIAAQYFVAARGVTGSVTMPHTIPTRIMNTGTSSLSSLPNMVTPSGTSARGWINPLWHLINDEPAMADTIASYSEYFDEVWFGSFVDVAKYLQEFYTATLTVDSADENTGISMTLTDRMFDGAFDYPLTIKVRLWNSWNQCTALQNGELIDSEIITYNTEKYALVKAIPDRGTITLSSGSVVLPGDADENGMVNLDDFIILKQNYGTATGATWSTGDFDGNGAVNLDDFIILKQNYGAGQ